MEKDKIIKEINKMGINQRSNTQQDLHEQETNRKAIEGIRESFMEKEQTNKEKLEAAYRTEIYNLKQEVAKQKQANVNNYETSLARLNFQENTIYTLEQEKEHYKHELEKMKKVNQNQGIELGHKSQEISNYITNEAKHNEGRHQLALLKLVDGLAEKMVRGQFALKRRKRGKVFRVLLVPNSRHQENQRHSLTSLANS